jgi:isoleucyl-tRNA synthetase
MNRKFKEYKHLDLSLINKEILSLWQNNNIFKKSLDIRKGRETFVFYEGPPSANGIPGIHHVLARTIKDIFCRYKTMKGYLVERKAGWDTHGLPVEIGVEKALGIIKDDIGLGKKISISDYNNECRREVMKYTDQWKDLTEKMGYWVDMQNPYITYDNKYIETLWWLLSQLYQKGLIYKGYSIQPYSPAAGTGLSTHELNQPGCYRDVKDTTCVAMFKVKRSGISEFLFEDCNLNVYFLAWTTTPWTLPSNTALCVGPNIVYVRVKTHNPYSKEPVIVVLAKDTLENHISFDSEKNEFNEVLNLKTKNNITVLGKELEGIIYEQLIPWVNPGDAAFRVITGDFVTTDEGTGIVHIAPTFGADDDKVAKINGIPALLLYDKTGNRQPMVDRTGKFFNIDDLDTRFVENKVNVNLYNDFAGRFVKNAFDATLNDDENSLDIDICVMLKQQGLAFKIEKHIHTYPHCWRTDKPVLYYPLDSWFIKTTAFKTRMIELNNTINWKPESTGSGRFGKWLENLQDWNLSRSRFWGTPLPIWRSEDGAEEICIGSVAELKNEIDRSVKAGFMKMNPLTNFIVDNNSDENYKHFDLHRPFVDDIILISGNGKKMFRESDLIDVWFDSGAMPYAQMHYPFEKISDDTISDKNAPLGKGFLFPADFVAEGVDQTRGWFFTLHAIAVMLFDSVAFRNIISNGLVLDKNGNKMSKRLGNAVDPFETIEKYGTDPLRWYMITNASPWDNLKFDATGIDEVCRKFFGTLFNTYSFFSLYANVDGFKGTEQDVRISERPEIDRWIISLLNSLINEVDKCYSDYEPTRAGRAIQDFVTEHLSNWYVRLNRKRFWRGEMDTDKISAYQTLYNCLITIAKLASPISPFISEQIYLDLNNITGIENCESIHLTSFPVSEKDLIDPDLEEKMELAQRITSMVLGLRRKVNIKVRHPLQKIMVSILDETTTPKIEAMKKIILTEVNVKELEFISDSLLVKKIKPNFKTLGPKYGRFMKDISAKIAGFSQNDIADFTNQGRYIIHLDNNEFELKIEDFEILSEDIPGWIVATEGKLTVTLDVTITDELIQEGIAREFINRIQNIRKDNGYAVTDKIKIEIQKNDAILQAVNIHHKFISSQTLAQRIDWVDEINDANAKVVEIDESVKTLLKITRVD